MHEKFLKFLPVVRAIGCLSKDPSTKVGAVVLDDDYNILVTGYNGFPRGVQDDPVRLSNRELKLKFVSHAEANAIAQAARVGAKLYGSTLVVTNLYPCTNCAKLIVQAGIKTVLAPKMSNEDAVSINQQWFEEAAYSEKIFAESGVEVIYYEEDRI